MRYLCIEAHAGYRFEELQSSQNFFFGEKLEIRPTCSVVRQICVNAENQTLLKVQVCEKLSKLPAVPCLPGSEALASVDKSFCCGIGSTP